MDPLVDQAPMVQLATKEQEDQGGQNKAEISSLLLTCNMYVSVLECSCSMGIALHVHAMAHTSSKVKSLFATAAG